MRIVIWGTTAFFLFVLALGLSVWLYWFRSDVAIATLERTYADAQSRFVTVNGVRLHYRESGRGPALILIHGYGDNAWSWEGWAAALKDRYRVIRIDLPGHGLTAAPADTAIDAAAFADLTAAFADKTGLSSFVVAGNSLGGAVAWQTALRHPDRVRALVLVDAAGWPQPAPKSVPIVFRLLQYRWARAVLASIDNAPLIVSSLKSEVGNPDVITPVLVSRWASLQLGTGHRRILLLNPAQDVATATPTELAKIRVPTLILWGTRDPVIGVADAGKFAHVLSGAKTIRYDGIGHLPQIEIPDRSARDVATFLRSLGD